ncbi:hypothetical protein GJV26_12455 [Massilia dura]|uniref:Ribbon-helix-helix protein, CopG family n=1 Tax=Pseudoduganella dura TaxID=321982 RepID=A0A6I3XNI6_9BURK|nr:hypothetical protein [Pseudoduganella dura]MUI13265.1 hypothetical protein [Pseudoduganella dura]GGX90515.1 hypothetical protein GCM10007386_21700 [Pseudoduganella dura]
MTTIELKLPRDLAEEAAEMGLLKSQVVADLLRDEIRRRTFSDLLQNGGYTAGSCAADEPVALPRRRKA